MQCGDVTDVRVSSLLHCSVGRWQVFGVVVVSMQCRDVTGCGCPHYITIIVTFHQGDSKVDVFRNKSLPQVSQTHFKSTLTYTFLLFSCRFTLSANMFFFVCSFFFFFFRYCEHWYV